LQCEQDVIEMNEACFCVSGWVQHAPLKVVSMIEGTGRQPTLRDRRQESSRELKEAKLVEKTRHERRTTMFKTISAAVLAVSMLAAPAFAAGKVAQTPAKTEPAKTEQAKTEPAKSGPAKTSVLNANAKMGKHAHSTKHARHHRHHVKYTAKRTHHAKVGFKHSTQAPSKRG
jgi:hypothetical protein